MNKQDVYMISKYGDIYPGLISNGTEMHPNPGTEDDEYEEIINAMEWICAVEKSARGIELVTMCLIMDISEYVFDEREADDLDVLPDVYYEDPAEHSDELKSLIDSVKHSVADGTRQDVNFTRLEVRRKLARYINQNYLRVRVGGKYDTQRIRTSFSGPEDRIYFRISSRGFDWRQNIEDFLWDYFDNGTDSNTEIWIGHDAETNPPEKVLFQGTFKEFVSDMSIRYLENARDVKRLKKTKQLV